MGEIANIVSRTASQWRYHIQVWLINHPFFVWLVPLVVVIVCLHRAGHPLWNETEPVTPADTTCQTWRMTMASMPSERAKTWRYEALVQGQRVVLYIQKDSSRVMPALGDTLLIYTRLDQSYVPSPNWRLEHHNQTPWWQTARGWQARLKERYEQMGITGRELGTLSALTLGYREDLDKDVRRSFSAAGAMHVLAVSGLHTGIMMSVLWTLITCFGRFRPLYTERKKRVIQGCIVMLLLIGYAFVTGCSPSVIRSVIMACLFLLAGMVDRHGNMLNILFASAFIMLAFMPQDLFSVSFQLSYSAVIAIVLFTDGWGRLLPKMRFRAPWKWCKRVIYYVYGLTGVSLAAQIGTMPFTLHYFGQISNYFLLTNMLVIPLAWLMMVGAVFFFLLGWITPLGTALAWCLNGLTWLLNSSVEWIENLPGAVTRVVLPSYGWGLLTATALLLLLIWRRVTMPHWGWKRMI